MFEPGKYPYNNNTLIAVKTLVDENEKFVASSLTIKHPVYTGRKFFSRDLSTDSDGVTNSKSKGISAESKKNR